jgi:hypothetical protein
LPTKLEKVLQKARKKLFFGNLKSGYQNAELKNIEKVHVKTLSTKKLRKFVFTHGLKIDRVITFWC